MNYLKFGITFLISSGLFLMGCSRDLKAAQIKTDRNETIELAKEKDLNHKKILQAKNEESWNSKKSKQLENKRQKVLVERKSIMKSKIDHSKKTSTYEKSAESQTRKAFELSQDKENTSTSKYNSSTSSIIHSSQNRSYQNNHQQITNTTPKMAPQVTSGFNFLNHHYPIASFSGNGSVPANNYIYRWNAIPNYFLVEKLGSAGNYINELTVGSTVVIDGHTYHIVQIIHGFKNTTDAASKIAGILNGSKPRNLKYEGSINHE